LILDELELPVFPPEADQVSGVRGNSGTRCRVSGVREKTNSGWNRSNESRNVRLCWNLNTETSYLLSTEAFIITEIW